MRPDGSIHLVGQTWVEDFGDLANALHDENLPEAVALRGEEAAFREREVVVHVLVCILPELIDDVASLRLFAEQGIDFGHIEGSAPVVDGHVVVRNFLLALLEHGQSLFFLSLFEQSFR